MMLLPLGDMSGLLGPSTWVMIFREGSMTNDWRVRRELTEFVC